MVLNWVNKKPMLLGFRMGSVHTGGVAWLLLLLGKTLFVDISETPYHKEST